MGFPFRLQKWYLTSLNVQPYSKQGGRILLWYITNTSVCQTQSTHLRELRITNGPLIRTEIDRTRSVKMKKLI